VVTDGAEDGMAAREAELAERERRATSEPADPNLLTALAKERDVLADARDDAADARDAAALSRRDRAAARDVAASRRDRRSRVAHEDADPGFADRFMSGRDVDASAGDRAAALHDERTARVDRHRSREDRQRAAADRDAAASAAQDAADLSSEEATCLREGMEGRAVIGQAQGLLMAEHGISGDQAFDLLVKASQNGNVKLRDIAAQLVERHANNDA
jgi:hypothetical protein